MLLVVLLATAGPAAAAEPCWRLVLDDWTDNARIDRQYAVACYDKALENLPRDLANYTDAFDQISDARQERLRTLRGLSSSSGEGSEESAATAGSNEPDDGDDGGPLGRVLGIGNDNAGSLPLPLLILAVLAALLMAAGAAGLLTRKLQARRAGPPQPPE